MNESEKNSLPASKRVRSVSLISGGLDSILAAKLLSDLGVEVHGVHFVMPWSSSQKSNAAVMAEKAGIQLMAIQLDENYLEIIKNPHYGYGSALNPCVDCKIYMFSRAREYMERIGANVVSTGEVLGQRPMSQLRHSMATIEKRSSLEGRLLRPLSAHNFEPTIAEKEGLIDRSKLLSISGRSRKEQLALAEKLGITGYLQPSGGCLLTDTHFARRMDDAFRHDLKDFRETTRLKWGRQFRISDAFKVIVGRDESENTTLRQHARHNDYLFDLGDRQGPTAVLEGSAPDEDTLKIAAGLVQRFSKSNKLPPLEVNYWQANQPEAVNRIPAATLTEEQIERMRI